MADIYSEVIEKIIKEQETIIGPLAVEQAKKVSGLSFNNGNPTIAGDKLHVLEMLVKQYEQIFGKASVEVCKDAASSFLSKMPANEVPSLLR